MTADEFRTLALSLPEAVESSHMGTADFRVRKKIFATLDTDKNQATLKLLPDQQAMLIDIHGSVFFPANGSWGDKGWTKLHLDQVDGVAALSGLKWAWENIAPKTLIRHHQPD